MFAPSLQLFSCLFPSWRFFEEIEPSPDLYYRAAENAEALGAWVLVLRPPTRSVRTLLLNAEGNLALACHSLVERLIADIADAEIRELSRAAELISYRLVQGLVVYSLPAELAALPALALQFKLTAPGNGATPAEDLLVSEVFSAASARCPS